MLAINQNTRLGIILTKKATIATINAKIEAYSQHFNQQFSSMRHRIGGLLGISHNGKRNLYSIYGYPEDLSGVEGFDQMYRYANREGISNRITWGLAKSCWRDGFEIFESAEKDAEQVLVDEMRALFKAGFNNKIERADILNRIGRMSVLFVGIPDGSQTPEEELGKVSGNPDKIIDQVYFQPYAYDEIVITKRVEDVASRRFGLPELYQLSRQGRDNEKDTTLKTIIVHWTRIIHLNENALCSDIEGQGALESVFNRILDLDKATGGSAEAYFRNSKGKIGYELDPKFAAEMLSDQAAKDKFQAGIEKYTNEYQDFTVAAGAKLKTLPTPQESPLDTVKVIMWSISGQTGIPMRILTGEGSGQLAGSEDQLAYNQIVKDRQSLKCKTWIDRLLEIFTTAGMLKDLPDNYDVRFPVQTPATETQKVENMAKKAQAFSQVMAGLSQLAGDSVKASTAFASIGLDDIQVEDIDLGDDDDNDNE